MFYGEVNGVRKPISRLVLGTMIINTRELKKSFDLLDTTFELGCTTLDTAHVYAGGESERGIGRWMEARGNRDKVVILSKGGHPNSDRKRVTPFDITADLHDSLARLRTDYIDIYVLHRDDFNVPIGVIVECLNEHLAAGRVRAIGGSNWTHQRIQEANEYAKAHDLVPFAASSPNYSLVEQVEDPWGPGCVGLGGPEQIEARKWYEKTQLPIFAYSSLGRGFLSGRITRENFDELKEKGMTVPQIATAYIMNQPLNAFALVGAANHDEFKANMEACELKLTPEETAWLDLRRDSR